MTTTPTHHDADVAAFVVAVRERLADLPVEEADDLTEGLEADLTDLVAERGGGALGDPDTYTRELRTAAGLEPVMRRPRGRRNVGAAIDDLLDRIHEGWDREAARTPGRPMAFLETVRPAWWIARAWAAVAGATLAFGLYPGAFLIPFEVVGWLILAIASVVSVQIGRKKWWPGNAAARGPGRGWHRLFLLALNCFAVFVIAGATMYLGSVDTRSYSEGFNEGVQSADVSNSDKAGIYVDGKWVSQIYPYDAQGHPLVGVQLFNQTGEPINVVTRTECVYGPDEQPLERTRQYFPWTDGVTQRRNVFPVPSKVGGGDTQDPDPLAFTSGPKPSVGQFPLVNVPKVSLPGITPSATAPGRSSYDPGQRPSTPITPVEQGC